MQRIVQFWKSGTVARIVIIIGLLIIVCICCITFLSVYTATSPTYQATATARTAATSTEFAKPTSPASPTETPRLTNTTGPTNIPTEIPTLTKTPTEIPTSTRTPTLIPILTKTPTPSYYIPSEFWGQEFGLTDKCVLSGDNCGRLPDEFQAQVGETTLTNIRGIQVEITLQDVSYVFDREWRKFITTFEFENPSDKTVILVSEELFNAWGNYGNWRGAIVSLNTKANFEIRPGSTQLNLEWTTNAHNNSIVFITINSAVKRGVITLNKNSIVYRVEFPPIPTKTPTPTRTPVN